MNEVIEHLEDIEKLEAQSYNILNKTPKFTKQDVLGQLAHIQEHKELDELLQESLNSQQPFWLRFSRFNEAILKASDKQKG